VLSPAMTKQMLTRQSDGFGLGFALEGTADRFGHNGADEGFQAYLTAFADSGRGLVIMANSDNGSRIFERLAASIGREYGWTALVARTPPLVEQLGLLARVKGVDHALAWYQTMRRETPAGEPTPWLLNRIGYELLGEARAADAVKVFEANVALYPGDANAYDSLAEGQLANGQRDAAIANYRKSLQLDPNNANAVKMLATLGVRWIRDTTPPR
jgi:tetratricopeptide (TPR) repeat protein